MPDEAKKRGVKPGAAFAKLLKGERVWARTGAAVATVKKEGAAKETKQERKLRDIEEKRLEALLVDGEGEGHWVEPSECVGEGSEGSVSALVV